MNKAVYTEGLVACCWAGAVTVLCTQHISHSVGRLVRPSVGQSVVECKNEPNWQDKTI